MLQISWLTIETPNPLGYLAGKGELLSRATTPGKQGGSGPGVKADGLSPRSLWPHACPLRGGVGWGLPTGTLGKGRSLPGACVGHVGAPGMSSAVL